MALTFAEARQLIKINTDNENDPVLSETEVDLLMKQTRICDEDGREPSDPNWEGAWNINLASANGWRWKAGKCANRYAFSDAVANYQRDQLYRHCLQQADLYRRSAATSVTVSTAILYNPVIGNADGAP